MKNKKKNIIEIRGENREGLPTHSIFVAYWYGPVPPGGGDTLLYLRPPLHQLNIISQLFSTNNTS